MAMYEIYAALPPFSFRVLDLLPGKDNDEIQCTLRPASLTEPPSYEALSYVWGTELSKTQISCDSAPFTTTAALYKALRHMRSSTATRTLWIDALYINQSSLTERSSQVQIMRQIYSLASNIILWLGPDTKEDDVPKALELLRLALAASRKENPRDQLNLEDRPKITWSAQRNAANGFPPSASADWNSLGRLLGRAWFRRMWIIQEAASSQNAVMMIGKHYFPWDEFLVAMFWLDKYAYTDRMLHWILVAPVNMILQAFMPVRLPLRRLMFTAQACGFQCTDPKDRVFALFGLSQEGHEPSPCEMVVPDYSLSFAQIYVNLVKHYLECNHSRGVKNTLEILESILHTDETLASNAIPSWIPQPSIVSTEVLRLVERASQDLPIQLKSSITSTTLILRGINLTSVTSVHTGLMYEGQNWSYSHSFKVVKSLWENYGVSLSAPSKLGSQQKAAQALVNALTHGLEYDGRARTYVDLEEFLTHDPEEEEWARLTQTGEINDQMRDTVAFLESLRKGKIFMTDDCKIGSGLTAMKEGDKVCVLFGGNIPFIVRQMEGGWYKLVGQCYIFDLVQGQAIEDLREGKFTEEWFELR